MTDAAYRRECALLRGVSSIFMIGEEMGKDQGFLRYVLGHAVKDGPGALYTPAQVERLERLANARVLEKIPTYVGAALYYEVPVDEAFRLVSLATQQEAPCAK